MALMISVLDEKTCIFRVLPEFFWVDLLYINVKDTTTLALNHVLVQRNLLFPVTFRA